MAILAVDEVMLREPRLLTPYQQPLGRVVACESVGIPKPTLCLVPSQGLNCIAGSGASLSLSAKMSIAAFGGAVAYQQDIVANEQFNGATLNWSAPAGSWTIICYHYTGDGDSSETAITNENKYIIDSQTGRLIVGQNVANGRGVYGPSAWLYAATGRYPDDKYFVDVASLNAGSGVRYVKSANISDSTSDANSDTNYSSALAFGGAIKVNDRYATSTNAAYNTLRARMFLLAIWRQALSVAQLDSLIADPFQITRPA